MLKELTEAESQECPTCHPVGVRHQRDGPGSHSRIKSITRPLAHRDFKRKQKEQGTMSHPSFRGMCHVVSCYVTVNPRPHPNSSRTGRWALMKVVTAQLGGKGLRRSQ